MTGSDNARLKPVPPFVPQGVGHTSSWTCVLCSRRSSDYTGRRKVLSSWACKERCK